MSIHKKSGFEYYVKGISSPNIAFINGFRMHFSSWKEVELKCRDDMNLLFFNRSGVGDSLRALEDQTGEVVTDAIYSLLMDFNSKESWVIVAHSLGGLYANLFARRYPDCIRGMLLVESAHPDEVSDRQNFPPPKWISTLNNGIKSLEKLFDRYKFSEDECITNTVSSIKDAKGFPNIPVIVISGTRKMPFVPEDAHNCHLSRQKELLLLSSKSRSVVAKRSGHFPQITEPEIVQTALKELLIDSAHS
ncbi:MAG: alpha/beta hydrolase [Natronospirillum sp.]